MKKSITLKVKDLRSVIDSGLITMNTAKQTLLEAKILNSASSADDIKKFDMTVTQLNRVIDMYGYYYNFLGMIGGRK